MDDPPRSGAGKGRILNNAHLHEVEYIVYGNSVVFSGLHNGKEGARTSTINAAESVVMAIAEAEGIDPRHYTFFDLQTFTSYARYQRGDFTYNQLTIDWRESGQPGQVYWKEGHGVPEVLEDFGHLIWGEGERGKPRNLKYISQD